MDNETAPLRKSRSADLLPMSVAFVLVVLVLGFGTMYAMLLLSDRLGTFNSNAGVADLDGDGDLDVIVANTRWESAATSFAGITLWTNQGRGRFSPSDQDLPGGFAAAAGDVDGDGDEDLLILSGSELMLSLNQGGAQEGKLGVFKTNNPIRPSNQWRGHIDMGGSVILGDLNNDGEVDGFVAACCYGSGEDPLLGTSLVPSSAWVWLNEWDPRGWLVRHAFSLTGLDGLPIRAAALGDLDRDGDLDVFAAIGAPTIGKGHSLGDLALLNDGSGNFTSSGQWLGASDSTAVALGDVDGDGGLDAVVGTQNGAVVWTNQGAAQGGREGGFAPSEQAFSGSQTRAVFLHDLDGDGDQDALIADPRQAVVWWNNGQAAFTPSDQRFRYSERHGLAIGDFDGDGTADIFSGAYSEAYSVWLNQGDGTFRARNRP